MLSTEHRVEIYAIMIVNSTQLTCLVLSSPVSFSRAWFSILLLVTCPPPEPGHFQWVATQLGSLSGPSLRVPCGTVTAAGVESASEKGRGRDSVNVWGKVPGCQASGREWRDRRRKERILLYVRININQVHTEIVYVVADILLLYKCRLYLCAISGVPRMDEGTEISTSTSG